MRCRRLLVGPGLGAGRRERKLSEGGEDGGRSGGGGDVSVEKEENLLEVCQLGHGPVTEFLLA